MFARNAGKVFIITIMCNNEYNDQTFQAGTGFYFQNVLHLEQNALYFPFESVLFRFRGHIWASTSVHIIKSVPGEVPALLKDSVENYNPF